MHLAHKYLSIYILQSCVKIFSDQEVWLQRLAHSEVHPQRCSLRSRGPLFRQNEGAEMN